MSKLDLRNRVPATYEKQVFADIISAICTQLNQLSEGRMNAKYNAASAAPTASIAYAVGDFVPDLNATVRGSVSPGVAASYVRIGWICTVAGTPGTWQEVRTPTGS